MYFLLEAIGGDVSEKVATIYGHYMWFVCFLIYFKLLKSPNSWVNLTLKILIRLHSIAAEGAGRETCQFYLLSSPCYNVRIFPDKIVF